MVQHIPEDSAVAYMRAAPTFRIRSNKYRPDHGLRPENIGFDCHLRSRVKYVYLEVTDTTTTAKHQYELKLQVIGDKEQWNQPTDPSLSPSSQGSITSPTEVESESGNAKRHNEIKTYLQYIKNGHNTIKNLEAFHQFRNADKLIVAQYFQICDAGNVKQLHLRPGDFDSSLLVSPGEGVIQPETNINPKEKPPELNLISAKSDVWRAGSIIFSLAKLYHSTNTKKVWKGFFEDLTEKERQEIVMDPRRVRPIDSHYSEDLDNMIKRSLALNHRERPSAAELLNELQDPATLRLNAKYMFRELPDWVGDKVFTEDNTFFEERLNELVQPGELEKARTMWKNEEAEERRLLKKSLKEKQEKEELDAKNNEEENLLRLQWAAWVERKQNLGSLLHLTDDGIDAMLDRWTVVRSQTLKQKLWVDPGPSYKEFCLLDASLGQ
ncbi:hypothetical protein EYC80_010665 [Monilinia laxa]|uniref:Protein kinase domain-containing protein n=1 Tax=Monilinia laxa TaxID=61186 RepID=A0A5N6JNV3_MONLA|nr:hypothetical protein EYC80_010665 [Monilinia laxa]